MERKRSSVYDLEPPVSAHRSTMTMPIAAIAIAIVALTGMGLLAHLNSGAGSPSEGKIASALEARDGSQIPIVSNGVTESDTITITGYYTGEYTTKLECEIDSFPVYCNGTPITIHGLPAGRHTLEITEYGNPSASSLSFSWIVS